ncbi:MAG TPA: hypothetical protein VGE02_04090 [Gemmatimonadales bacterium]
MRERHVRLIVAAAVLVSVPAPLAAQRAGHGSHDVPAVDPVGTTAHAQMAGHIDASAHMRLTAARTPTGDDSARAARIERELLPVLARYADVRAAERDGYEMFAPEVRTQRVYHFTKRSHALRNSFGFDPARPTSLLYTRDEAGQLVLSGAMYTAPARADEDALDERVPLSIARWHLHTNVCVPGRSERARWAEREDGQMRFGPAGAIATEEACDAVGGRWRDHVFGWMVHANLVHTASGPRIEWIDDHRDGH